MPTLPTRELAKPLSLSSLQAFGPVNPQPARLGRENAIFSGSSTKYSTSEVDGWLSIKTMLSGSAVWETPERRFTVDQDSYLILNDRHRYTLRMDSPQAVTTFVLFFRRGFVEEVYRCATTPAARLVDDPHAESGPVGFFERLEPFARPLGQLLQRFRRRIERDRLSAAESDDWFTRIAERMVREHRKADAAMASLPALRPATRLELYRRVSRGRDYLLAWPAERVTLEELAREACLSPYHFHRVFRAAFGCAPHEYLTRQRLERARRLLLKTRRSVTDICFEIGFESLGSFSSLFRRRFGVPPSALRGGQGKIRKIEEASLQASA